MTHIPERLTSLRQEITDLRNMNAIYAMDTIQGLGAKLVWITPKARQEIEKRNPSGH